VHDVFHISQLKKCEQILEAQIIEENIAMTLHARRKGAHAALIHFPCCA
jgi:hypothetical protein